MTILNSFEKKVLGRETSVLHVFSDVYSNLEQDFDAELTTDYRSWILDRSTHHGIGDDIERGAYGVELIYQLNQLVRDEVIKLCEAANDTGRPVHKNVQRAISAIQDNTVRVVANCAPRNGEHNNGRDFHLAITDNEVEVYAAPLEFLKYIRDRVLSLFRIPNEGHPVFDGAREQFRSSVIARSGEYPQHLEKIYSVEEVDELRERLKEPDFSPIPEQQNALEIVFQDKFGNLRCRAKRLDRVFDEIDQCTNGHWVLGVQVGDLQPIPAHLTSNLDGIPGGELGFYRNVADGESALDDSGYWELAAKWPNGSGDKSTDSAYERLRFPKSGTPLNLVQV